MSGAYVTIMDTMLMILVICALRFLLPDETLLLLGGDRFPVVRYV